MLFTLANLCVKIASIFPGLSYICHVLDSVDPMKRRYIWVLCILALYASPERLWSQWSVAVPNLIQNTYLFGGTMHFSNGVLWAGAEALFSSHDSGRTWIQRGSFPGEQVAEIVFFDKFNGVLSTVDRVFKTLDGGLTWNAISNRGNYSVTFGSNPNIIHVMTGFSRVYTTFDGGLTWTSSAPDQMSFGLSMVRRHGKLYVFGGNFTSPGQSEGWVAVSEDEGLTWVNRPGIADGDCFSIFADPCLPDVLYLANEDHAIPDNRISEIYRSTDDGVSWQTMFGRNAPFVAGSITGTANTLYAGTLSDAILRSTDKGVTWTQQAGPTSKYDSRAIACINDNIVFSLAEQGSVWKTTNAGGSFISSAKVLSFDAQELFRTDTVGCNDSVKRTVHILKSCNPPDIQKVWIYGVDQAKYDIVEQNNDSITVLFTSDLNRSHQAYLVIQASDGQLDTIPLFGTAIVGPDSLRYSTHELFKTDTVACDTIVRTIRLDRIGCVQPTIKAITISGPDSATYQLLGSSNDSIRIAFASREVRNHNGFVIVEGSNDQRDTIRLFGNAVTPHDTIIYSTRDLFQTDTIGCNDTLLRTISLQREGCVPPGIKSITIGGPDSSHYQLDAYSPDSIRIGFSSNNEREHQGFIIVEGTNGQIDTIMLSGTADLPPDSISYAPRELFRQDTVGCDSTSFRSVALYRTGCILPDISKITIAGPDSASYTLIGSTGDSIHISFTGTHSNSHSGYLIIEATNGQIDTISLFGEAALLPGTLEYSTHDLFRLDTIDCSDTIFRTISIRRLGCLLPQIVSMRILGPDSASYAFEDVTGDSISISFTSTRGGEHSGRIVIEGTNGQIDTIDLFGTADIPSSTLQYSATELFRQDTVRCDTIFRNVSIVRSGCALPTLDQLRIVGPDSARYRIVRVAPDVIEVAFSTDGSHEHDAQLILEGSNGQRDTIRLFGRSRQLLPLSFDITNAIVDTIGGTARLPIMVRGLVADDIVEVVVHYDPQLDYIGSFSETGAPLDIPNSQWKGRAKIRAQYTQGNPLLGYAYFTVFADSVGDRIVTFDSATVSSFCRYVMPVAATSTITPPAGCGAEIISRFLHLGERPKFTIHPNPAEHRVTIASAGDDVECVIQLIDVFGKVVLAKQATIGTGKPQTISLEHIASGAYMVRIETLRGAAVLHLIRQ